MEKLKPYYQIIFIIILVGAIVGLTIPVYWQRISKSRLAALETVAASLEVELEQALSEQNKQSDNWLFINSKFLALEPWGETESAQKIYRFLDYQPPETYSGLKSFNAEYLRKYFTVIYQGDGKFKVEVIPQP